MIICVNLRGLRDNYMPAELAEIRRQGIYKIQGDNSYLFWKSVVCAQQFWLFLHHWIETNWFVMSKTNTYICPVCGYDKMSEPPCDDLGYPTYVICSCCGFEFGFDDESKGLSFSEYRQRWINNGFTFFSVKKKPTNWNERVMRRQLENIGK